MQCLSFISKRTRKNIKSFAVCGNKDKRGITTQRVSSHRCHPLALINSQKSRDWNYTIKCGNYKKIETAYHLGQLSGNRFSLALRFIDIDYPDADIQVNIDHIMKHGFINYYGM